MFDSSEYGPRGREGSFVERELRNPFGWGRRLLWIILCFWTGFRIWLFGCGFGAVMELVLGFDAKGGRDVWVVCMYWMCKVIYEYTFLLIRRRYVWNVIVG